MVLRDKMTSHPPLPATVWETPPSSLRLRDDEVHVWRFSLDLPKYRVESLLGSLDEDEVLRAYRFQREADTTRYIAAHGLLRSLLARHLNVRPDEVRYQSNRWGRPYLDPEIHEAAPLFNFSHSHQIAICAISRDRVVGVDIEYIRPLAEYEKIAEQFFSPREIESLTATPEPMRQRAFFSLWTRKEAYVKALGKGLAIPLNQFDVSTGSASLAGQSTAKCDSSETTIWSIQNLVPAIDYVGAVAVEGGTPNLRCWDW